jgi:hypothetical protein
VAGVYLVEGRTPNRAVKEEVIMQSALQPDIKAGIHVQQWDDYDLFSQDNRVVLDHQANAAPDLDRLGNSGCSRQRHKQIV